MFSLIINAITGIAIADILNFLFLFLIIYLNNIIISVGTTMYNPFFLLHSISNDIMDNDIILFFVIFPFSTHISAKSKI